MEDVVEAKTYITNFLDEKKIDDVTKKRKDTIGYEPVLKYFEGRDFKNMFIVPGIEGKLMQCYILLKKTTYVFSSST